MQRQKHWEKSSIKENDKISEVAEFQPPFLKICFEKNVGMTGDVD